MRPRMKAIGAISITFFSRYRSTFSGSSMSYSASYSGRKIGIDFFLQSSGQKSQAFAGFDRGPRQNDPVHPLREQGGYRHGDRKVSFPGACRTDPNTISCDSIASR